MNIKTNKEDLLLALQKVTSVIEKRHTLPILANILIMIEKGMMIFIGTDMEIEIQTQINIESNDEGSFTLPARKFLDLTRLIDDGSTIHIKVDSTNAIFTTGRSKFTLGTLPAAEFPVLSSTASLFSLKINESALKALIEKTMFAMALQDVRYYLNGMLFELRPNFIRSVATDGHRLALADYETHLNVVDILQFILPRKTVLELNRLLSYRDEPLGLEITSNYIRVYHNQFVLASKLIDGKFPDYERVIPQNSNKHVYVNRLCLKLALQRASILSNEKYRGIQFLFSDNLLHLQAHNPEHEIAEEDIDIHYSFEPLTIGFNVTYLIDVLNILDSDQVILNLYDENSSVLVHSLNDTSRRYVVMPMRL
ncbi:MAG: DNA polymerase III subunit beta [Gammaproteobacteria bacterium]|nr:DNA polymerase III subunit beta [Gammaproteobacteria bacterium]MBU1656195.1 DNA polymerase III subunit beta [Gammaproteobacteria bacterium]MBU1959760.1 DNA polymerase III subunit beta [Gammaproteobacteria bacterium]